MSDTKRVLLVDVGIANVHSISKALLVADDRLQITYDFDDISRVDALVLPGVGSFAAASTALAPHRDSLRAALQGGLPGFGICLGMQLLFSRSEEGAGDGLDVIGGEVTALRTPRRPHMGWNQLEWTQSWSGSELDWAYYANSFVCRPADESVVAAWTEYDGDRFPAAVRSGSIFGVQFHPEKSSKAGLGLLRGFFEEAMQCV